MPILNDSLAAKFGLAASSVLVTVFMLELAMRVVYPHSVDELDLSAISRSSTRPGQMTELIPNARNEHFVGGMIRINALGLRGAEILLEKPAGTFRLLAVGDSITFGYGVEEGAVFHQLLNPRASDPGALRYEVINAGLPGAGLPYAYHLIRTRCAELDPDLILLSVGMNDIVAYGPDAFSEAPTTIARQPASPLRRASATLHRRSYLYAKLYLSLKSVLYSASVFDLNATQGYTFTALQESSPSLEAAWHSSFAVLDATLAQASACEAPLAIVVFPLEIQISEDALERYRTAFRLQVGPDAMDGLPQRRLLDFGQARGVAVIDLLPAFQQRARDPLFLRDRTITLDPVHPSTLGHALAAEYISEALVTADLIPRGDVREEP